jgi:hypothetical protein
MFDRLFGPRAVIPFPTDTHNHRDDLVPGALDVQDAVACLNKNAVALTRLVAGASGDLSPSQAERLADGLRDIHGQIERACLALCSLGEPLPAPPVSTMMRTGQEGHHGPPDTTDH